MPNTLTDKAGNTYRIVSSNWMRAVIALSILNFVILMLIIAGLIDNIQTVQGAMSFNTKTAQRNAALGDIAAGRAEANIWAFNQTCRWVKLMGEKCMEDPKWWADPEKYPLIVDDPAGAGLFDPHRTKK